MNLRLRHIQPMLKKDYQLLGLVFHIDNNHDHVKLRQIFSDNLPHYHQQVDKLTKSCKLMNH